MAKVHRYEEVISVLEGGEKLTPTEIGVKLGFDAFDASARVHLILKRLVSEGKVIRADLSNTESAKRRRGRYVVYFLVQP